MKKIEGMEYSVQGENGEKIEFSSYVPDALCTRTISDIASELADLFETRKREDRSEYVTYKAEKPADVHDALYRAHGDRLPDDDIYGAFVDFLDTIGNSYGLNTPSDLEDVTHEIVDAYVDVYTHDLTAWLARDIRNVSYMEAAREELGAESGPDLLMGAQYMFYNEVMAEVVSLLTARYEAQ